MRNGWQEVAKELQDFKRREVWRKIKIRDVPAGKSLIGSKWVFKLKRNGVFRSGLVALGHRQIPGIDFTDNFSAVVHDVTLRIALILWIVWDSVYQPSRCRNSIPRRDIEGRRESIFKLSNRNGHE